MDILSYTQSCVKGILFKKLIFTQLAEKFLTLNETGKFTTGLMKGKNGLCSEPDESSPYKYLNFFKICINVIIQSMISVQIFMNL